MIACLQVGSYAERWWLVARPDLAATTSVLLLGGIGSHSCAAPAIQRRYQLMQCVVRMRVVTIYGRTEQRARW